MQCYAELAAPTAVSHSLSLPLLSASGNNLVVSKGSLIQVFDTRLVPSDPSLAAAAATTPSRPAASHDISTGSTIPLTSPKLYTPQAADGEDFESSALRGTAPVDHTPHTKLVLVAEFSLAGTIIGLASVAVPGLRSGGHALLVAFKAAKMCLAEWDPDRRTLETISIHLYEQDDIQGAPWEAPLSDYVSFLEADPRSRCAALKFGARSLAILPFKSPDEDLDLDRDDWDELNGPVPEPAPPTGLNSSATLSTGKEAANISATATADAINKATSTPGAVSFDTPFSSSFVLRLPQIDSSLTHPGHLTFLHQYREPTFGILASTLAPSHSLGRKDHLSYKVFTLDLHQRASTTILSVDGLPQDLVRIVAIPPPAGGAILLGCNELIHVDQSGRTNGVAVNPSARQCTSFSLVDQSDLHLRLEHCVLTPLSPASAGELLLVLSDGRLAVVTLRLDGRTVSGMNVRMVPPEAILTSSDVAAVCRAGASCISPLGESCVFIGSEDGDSVVLGWARKQRTHVARSRRLRLIDDSFEYDPEAVDLMESDLGSDDDDDLYGDSGDATVPNTASHGDIAKTGDLGAPQTGELVFSVHDWLLSIAPVRDLAVGKSYFFANSEEERNSAGVVADLQLALAIGRGAAGALAIVNRNIQPHVVGRFDFAEARGFWAMSARKPASIGLGAAPPDRDDSGAAIGLVDMSAQYDKYMIVSKVDLDGYETSDVFALTAAGFEALAGTEFEPAAGFTVEAGTMGDYNRIVQVLKAEVRCYDGDLGLSQILPMLDDETGSEPRVVSASIADPYLLLVRDDASVFIAQMDANNELEELDRPAGSLVSTRWVSGCLYADVNGVFLPGNDAVLMFLLSAPGALAVYALPDMSPIFLAEALSIVPPHLTPNFAIRKGTAREEIVEILVADLGDSTSRMPHLILRHENDNLTLYEPITRRGHDRNTDSIATLGFKKICNWVTRPTSTVVMTDVEVGVDDDYMKVQARRPSLRACRNIGGYCTVFLPGPSPGFVLKTSKTTAKLVGLQGGGVRGMSPFHTEGCDRGFIYVDLEGIARVTQLPALTGDTSLADLGISVRRARLGEDPRGVTYHPPSNTYVVAIGVEEPFELPRDDDHHREWAREQIAMTPLGERGELWVVSPINWTVVHRVEMDTNETVECIRTADLEVSEDTHEQRLLVAVGTAVARGEDLPVRGRVHVLDVVRVVPEPDRPETDRQLRTLAVEEIARGAVTALCEVGAQGLLLVAQGQKCMVRGLKEDGTLLPVAFMDMSCHIVSVRELRGSGLCLLADGFRGLSFVGYTEEPYRMVLLGKSSPHLALRLADFLPHGTELSIIGVDTEGDLHVFEFNPDHPKSIQGHRLLHRTSFATAPNCVTSTLLLPRTTTTTTVSSAAVPSTTEGRDVSATGAPHVLLLASPTGQLAQLTPLAESAYRRLSSVATQLAAAVPTHLGLSARAHRLPAPAAGAAATLPVGVPLDASGGAGRGIVDGAVLARWREVGAGKRAEIASKAGYEDMGAARDELEAVLGWGTVAYF